MANTKGKCGRTPRVGKAGDPKPSRRGRGRGSGGKGRGKNRRAGRNIMNI